MLTTALRVLIALLTLCVLAALGSGCYFRHQLQKSLPMMEGTEVVAGLSLPVTVARDGLGIPTITGATRADVARALGFVHAQERFFQMDLQRRQAAGELSGLVGPRGVSADRLARVHRFRHIAGEAYSRTEGEWRGVLDAYAGGVNQGLAALDAPPFEYALLGATPAPWQPEDAILTILAMFNTLQGRQAAFERTVAQLHAALPPDLARFLTVAGSEWEAPVSGAPVPRPPIPGPDVVDLRAMQAGRRPAASTTASAPECLAFPWRAAAAPWCGGSEAGAGLGSNNWAVDAAHSTTGALLANDMHLDLGVPNIWYRASLVFPDPSEPLRPLRLDGVTLPGLPSMVVGSNGYVAWGFTNSNGDWSDLVPVEPAPGDPDRYLTPEGPRTFEAVTEQILVLGEASIPITTRWTIWGPLVWTDAQGREYAQRWVAHDPDVLSSDITRPERVRTVHEALVAAAGLGIPNQNFTVADNTGAIGWTIAGVIPKRRNLDGLVPASWADGTRGWDGYLDAFDFPRIVNPEAGRIWTANAPVVDGARLALLGDGGYSDAIRARMIRDRLMAIERASAADMLDIQLEDGALFLERWRTLVLTVLQSPEAARGTPDQLAARQEFGRLVEGTWTGRASPDSVAYTLVRAFRGAVVQEVMEFVTTAARDADASFDYTRSPRSEGPVWDLVAARPMHLLSDRYASWDGLLVAAVDAAIATLTRDGGRMADRTWGEANRARIAHPLASAVPVLGRWLRMPSEALPGDVFTPRAQSARRGPSQRLVVSPGREADAILHMPGGQSAHPLSPHFDDMHRSWLDGEPVPLRPGPAVTTLTLAPPGNGA